MCWWSCFYSVALNRWVDYSFQILIRQRKEEIWIRLHQDPAPHEGKVLLKQWVTFGRVGLWGVKPNCTSRVFFFPQRNQKPQANKENVNLCEGPCCFLQFATSEMQRKLCFPWQTQQVQLAPWVAGDWKRINRVSPASRVSGSLHSRSARGRWCVLRCPAAGSTLHSTWLPVQMLTQGYRKALRDCSCARARSPVRSHAWVTYWGEIKRAKTPNEVSSSFPV